MPVQGSVLTDIQPVVSDVLGTRYDPERIAPFYSLGLDAKIKQQFISTRDRFRIGQTVYFVIELFVDKPGVTEVRFQSWWLRPARAFRAVGPGATDASGYFDYSGGGIDTAAFGPPGVTLSSTDRVWVTPPKRLADVPPPPAGPTKPPLGKSWSTFLADVWVFPIQPQSAVAAGYSQRYAFHFPAHGYQLAITSELVGTPDPGPGIGEPIVELSWKTGATHAIIQEPIG